MLRRIIGLVLVALAVSACKTAQLKPVETFRDCANCPEMVVIPAGMSRTDARAMLAKMFARQRGSAVISKAMRAETTTIGQASGRVDYGSDLPYRKWGPREQQTIQLSSLTLGGITVTGSGILNFLECNGLGVVGDRLDIAIDGAEWVNFNFDAGPATDVSIFDPIGTPSPNTIEVFGLGGVPLGLFEANSGKTDISALVGNVPITSFRYYGNNGVGRVSYVIYSRPVLDSRGVAPEDSKRVAATGLNKMAELYQAQGRYAKAETLYKRALAIYETALGPEHPDVATDLNNLAELYQAQGRYAEAETLYERALAIMEKALGPAHPSAAAGLNDLAALYKAQGRYAEAEPLYERALAIMEKALGPAHPSAAAGLNDLALLYQAQGRYAEAEPLYERALAIMEKALGPAHPSFAPGLNNLAALYKAQGRYAEAEPLYKRALAIKEKARRPKHLSVATGLNNLAALYHTQSRQAEAEPLYKRALAIYEKALQPEHPNVATILENYADLLRETGRTAEADDMEARADAIRDKWAKEKQ